MSEEDERVEKIIYSDREWRREASKLLLRLLQEVQALNPGLDFSEINLDPIVQYGDEQDF